MKDKALYETCKASQDGRMKKWIKEIMKDKEETMKLTISDKLSDIIK